MVTLLEKIVARKQREIATARERVSEAELESVIEQSSPPIDFFGALSAPGPIRLIAEFKRKSPSAGSIRPGAVVEDIARAYASAGASALSILTDADDFGGSLDDLSAAKRSVALPILRKEFIVDRYQVLEARAAGADRRVPRRLSPSQSLSRDSYSGHDTLGRAALAGSSFASARHWCHSHWHQ